MDEGAAVSSSRRQRTRSPASGMPAGPPLYSGILAATKQAKAQNIRSCPALACTSAHCLHAAAAAQNSLSADDVRQGETPCSWHTWRAPAPAPVDNTHRNNSTPYLRWRHVHEFILPALQHAAPVAPLPAQLLCFLRVWIIRCPAPSLARQPSPPLTRALQPARLQQAGAKCQALRARMLHAAGA